MELPGLGCELEIVLPEEKVDLTRPYRSAYTAAAQPAFVDLNIEAVYAGITGVGDPDGAKFSTAVETLYPVTHAIKAACKQQGRDFGVPRLERLWWVEGSTPPMATPRAEWH